MTTLSNLGRGATEPATRRNEGRSEWREAARLLMSPAALDLDEAELDALGRTLGLDVDGVSDGPPASPRRSTTTSATGDRAAA